MTVPNQIKGRIVVYSIVGCSHCLDVKDQLHKLDLPYTDISLDVFNEEREILRKRLKKSTPVPQVFFNEIHIGGATEFKALVDNKACLNKAIQRLQNEYPPSSAPVPPLRDVPSTENNSICQIPLEPDEYSLLIKQMIDDGVIRDHKMSGIFGSTEKECFTGNDLVKWAVQVKRMTKAQAIDLGTNLLRRNVGRKVKNPTQDDVVFTDSPTLYRVIRHSADTALNVNCHSDTDKSISTRDIHTARSFQSVGVDMRRVMAKIYSSNLSGDGKRLKYGKIFCSSEFTRYRHLASSLKYCELLTPDPAGDTYVGSRFRSNKLTAAKAANEEAKRTSDAANNPRKDMGVDVDELRREPEYETITRVPDTLSPTLHPESDETNGRNTQQDNADASSGVSGPKFTEEINSSQLGSLAAGQDLLESTATTYAATTATTATTDALLPPRHREPPTVAEFTAFFINVYNSLTVHALLLRSTEQRSLASSLWQRWKFFNDTAYVIAGHRYSLQDIENGVLRGNRRGVGQLSRPFGRNDLRPRVTGPIDARIHFALVCGARGCPPISVYSSYDLDRELASSAAVFLADPSSLQLNVEKKSINLSSIFKWYREDFGNNDREVLDFIFSNMNAGEKRKQLKQIIDSQVYNINYIPYDWSLNEAK